MQRLEMEIAPLTVLPCQLHDPVFGAARLLPEKRLMLAVLQDAVLTFHHYARVEWMRPPAPFAEVEAWFASDDTEWPFSFSSICHVLNLDPGYIRGGLERWQKPAEDRATLKPLARCNGGMRHRAGLAPITLRRIA